MKINSVNLNFKQGISYQEKLIKNRSPKTKEGASQYFLDVDKVTKAMPARQEAWDKLYMLNMPDSLLLIDAIKLTYKNHNIENPYPELLISNNNFDFMKSVKNLIQTDGILNEDEQEKFLDKTKGAYKLEQIAKYDSLKLNKTDEIKDNLSFIKELMQDDNKEVFEVMSPATLVGILYNRYLSCEDFSDSLNLIYEDEVLNYPKEEIRETIHEYLLGESYSKISTVEEFDTMFNRI